MTSSPHTPQNTSPHTSPLSNPESVGQMLRQAREHLGLSIADVAAVTRIPRNMLEHLERDRFDEYAASVFTRGHIINFAREVRLDPERVLAAYAKQSGQRSPSQQMDSHSPRHPRKLIATLPSLPATKSSTGLLPAVAVPQRATPAQTTSKTPRSAQLHKLAELIKPVHMVSILLMLCALFVGAFFLNGSSATAQGAAAFEADAEDEVWSLERDADQARWFLEQPAPEQQP